MNKSFSILFIMLLLSCKGQNKSGVSPKDSVVFYNQSDGSENKTLVEKYLAKYVDSIEKASSENELPHFLYDNQFDYKHKGIWPTLHTPISIRSLIINRVNNCNALMVIIKSKNAELRKKPFEEDGLAIPFMDFSFYDLTLQRRSILNCKE